MSPTGPYVHRDPPRESVIGDTTPVTKVKDTGKVIEVPRSRYLVGGYGTWAATFMLCTD